MFKISKNTGIFASLIILVISIISFALNYAGSAPIFNAILCLGIAGSVLFFVSVFTAEDNMNNFIFICLVIGLLAIITNSILMCVGLEGVEKPVMLPFILVADSLAVISTIFCGVAHFSIYK